MVKPEFTLMRSASGRIVECRMTGLFSDGTMQQAAEAIRHETDAMEGKRHIVLADMRGMKTVHPSIAVHLGEAFRYQREGGCVLCVHVCDDTVQRLQARRLARASTETDDITVEVDTIEAARVLAKSYERHLEDPSYPPPALLRGAPLLS